MFIAMLSLVFKAIKIVPCELFEPNFACQGAAWTDNEHELDKWRRRPSLPASPRQWVAH